MASSSGSGSSQKDPAPLRQKTAGWLQSLLSFWQAAARTSADSDSGSSFRFAARAGKQKMKQKLQHYCLEDTQVMEEFPWDALQKKTESQENAGSTPAQWLHPPKRVEMGPDPAAERNSWKLTIVSSIAAVAVVLAVAGWSCALLLGRQLQQEREAGQLSKSRADLLASMTVQLQEEGIVSDESLHQAYSAAITRTDLLPEGNALWAFLERGCQELAEYSQKIRSTTNLYDERAVSMCPITLHGSILEEMVVNGIPKYLILDESGDKYLAYMEDGSGMTVGDFVYIRGWNTGAIEYVDEYGNSETLDEVIAEVCQ